MMLHIRSHVHMCFTMRTNLQKTTDILQICTKYLVNVLKFTKYLVNVHKFTKYLVNVHKIS